MIDTELNNENHIIRGSRGDKSNLQSLREISDTIIGHSHITKLLLILRSTCLAVTKAWLDLDCPQQEQVINFNTNSMYRRPPVSNDVFAYFFQIGQEWRDTSHSDSRFSG